MSIVSLITLLALGGIAGTVFYYRDGIQDAFASKEQKELQLTKNEYEFGRQQKEDLEWDASGWNPDNWGQNKSTSKNQTKQVQKGEFDPNNDPSKFNPPNTQYNKSSPYGYGSSKSYSSSNRRSF